MLQPGQRQVGWGFVQPDLVGGAPAHAGGWDWVVPKVPSNPNHSVHKDTYQLGGSSGNKYCYTLLTLIYCCETRIKQPEASSTMKMPF